MKDSPRKAAEVVRSAARENNPMHPKAPASLPGRLDLPDGNREKAAAIRPRATPAKKIHPIQRKPVRDRTGRNHPARATERSGTINQIVDLDSTGRI